MTQAKRAGAAFAAALAAASAGAAPLPSAAPLCATSVALEPERAHPGQQVLYRLSVLVRDDVFEISWEEAPSFPGLRAERLAARPVAGEVERDGAVYLIREDARALFADVPGRVTLPPARILCRARGPAGESSARIETPGSVLEVLRLPEAGRGPSFRDLVGPLSLRRTVTPERVALGQSVRVTVTLQGTGNLWDAPEPELGPEAIAGAEVFRRPGELELDRGERLLARRRFAFDVVPRREGALRIPAVAWAYFDPTTGQYAEVVAEAMEVPVGPPTPPPESVGPAERAPLEPEPDAPAATGPDGGGTWALGGTALAAALGAAGWLAWRRRRARATPALHALARADSARAAGDRDGELAELARAVRAALAAPIGAAADAPPEAILASATSSSTRRAAEILAGLERARFDPTAEPPERAAILSALGALGARPPARARLVR